LLLDQVVAVMLAFCFCASGRQIAGIVDCASTSSSSSAAAAAAVAVAVVVLDHAVQLT
jgi:hypothetical protein